MNRFSLFLLLATLAFFTSCSLDDDGPAGPVITISPTFEVINQNSDFSLLSRALNRSGLDSALVRANVFTLFAPNDAAWAASGIDVETIDSTELNDLLRYHILLSGGLSQTTLPEGQVYLTTANINSPGAEAVMLFLERTGDDFTINNASRIVERQLVGTNAFIHPIDVVLRPPTVMGLLEANPDLSRMTALFNDAEALADGTLLADSLRRPGPFTLFGVLNDNFPTDLALTPAETRTVALYNIVSNRSFRFEDFPSSFTTLQGDNVNIFGRSVVTSGSQSLDLQFENIQATNGTLHLLSGLMFPEGL